MAHIRRHGAGWQVIVYAGIDPESGKKKYVRQTVKGSQRQAEKLAYQLEHEVSSNTYIPPSQQCLGEYLLDWLEKYAVNLRPRTYKSYKMIITQHLIPGLGKVRLDKLSPLQIRDYYDKKLKEGRLDRSRKPTGESLSPRTVQHHHRVLREALAHAVKWQLIARNPADAVEAPKAGRAKMQVLSPEEAKVFLQTAKQDRLYPFYLCALALGLRLGELLGLRWQDVDLESGFLHVVQQLEKPGLNPVFGPPKSDSSRRTVSIPGSVVSELYHWKAQQNEERLFYGHDYCNYNLVFSQPNGRPLSPSSLERWSFKPLLRKAGLPNIRFHDLRHSSATLLLAMGEHPKVVQERLGHSSITLTMDTYSHMIPTLQKETAEKIDAFLLQTPNTKKKPPSLIVAEITGCLDVSDNG